LWRIDLLLGKDLETKNETTAVYYVKARCTRLYKNRVTGANDVFVVVRAEELT
jgi:hypothetical protein